MRIRTLLAGIVLAASAGATLGISSAAAWTPQISGDAHCTDAPRTAATSWAVTWLITNATEGPGTITAEHDTNTADQQLVGEHLDAGASGFLVATYPATVDSDTLTVTITWATGEHKTIAAEVHQPKGCTVYVSPAVPEPTWRAEHCDYTTGTLTEPAYTTAAITGVHYDVVVDGVHHDAQPAGSYVVTLPQRDVEVFVQAWDDTSGALIQQWTHTFTYSTCTANPPPPPHHSTSAAPPVTTSNSHIKPAAAKPAAVKPAARTTAASPDASVTAPSQPNPAQAALAYTGAALSPRPLVYVALGLVLAGIFLTAAAVKYYPGRKTH